MKQKTAIIEEVKRENARTIVQLKRNGKVLEYRLCDDSLNRSQIMQAYWELKCLAKVRYSCTHIRIAKAGDHEKLH